MYRITRRELLMRSAALLSMATTNSAGLITPARTLAEVGKVDPVAADVYFHEGNLSGHGHCNNGWVIFTDYVLVIDANFPSGAQEILPMDATTGN